MLAEIPNARQIPGEPRRRWFHSPDMDLIVWFADHEDSPPIAFQLCYDKAHGEKALSWKTGRGFAHMNVDDGEQNCGKHKGTPLLLPDGVFDCDEMHRRFMAAGSALPAAIRTFVTTRLAQAQAQAQAQNTDHKGVSDQC